MNQRRVLLSSFILPPSSFNGGEGIYVGRTFLAGEGILVGRTFLSALHPAAVWLLVLAAMFVTEYSVMMALPWLLPPERSPLLEAAVDAILLISVLAPVIWWTVVRPLREVIRLRNRFLADLFARIEADRRHMARELHDGTGQSLSLLISGLRSVRDSLGDPDTVGRYEHLLKLASQALTDVKRLALGLRPSVLDDLGLEPALERLVEDLRQQHP